MAGSWSDRAGRRSRRHKGGGFPSPLIAGAGGTAAARRGQFQQSSDRPAPLWQDYVAEAGPRRGRRLRNEHRLRLTDPITESPEVW